MVWFQNIAMRSNSIGIQDDCKKVNPNASKIKKKVAFILWIDQPIQEICVIFLHSYEVFYDIC